MRRVILFVVALVALTIYVSSAAANGGGHPKGHPHHPPVVVPPIVTPETPHHDPMPPPIVAPPQVNQTLMCVQTVERGWTTFDVAVGYFAVGAQGYNLFVAKAKASAGGFIVTFTGLEPWEKGNGITPAVKNALGQLTCDRPYV